MLKAITNFKIHQILFKYWFTLWHFAMDDPVCTWAILSLLILHNCTVSVWWVVYFFAFFLSFLLYYIAVSLYMCMELELLHAWTITFYMPTVDTDRWKIGSIPFWSMALQYLRPWDARFWGNGKSRVAQNSCNLRYLIRRRQEHHKAVQLKVFTA